MESAPNPHANSAPQESGEQTDAWDILQEAQAGSRQDRWQDDESWDILQEAHANRHADQAKETEERWETFFEAQNEPPKSEEQKTTERWQAFYEGRGEDFSTDQPSEDAEGGNKASAEDTAITESEAPTTPDHPNQDTDHSDFQPPAIVDNDKQLPAIDKPFTAVNLHREFDANQRARFLAEQRLNKELQSGGKMSRFLKGIWKGKLMREYYLQKGYDEAYQQIQDKTAGKETDLTDAEWNASNPATINRVVGFAVDGYENMLHEAAGEKLYEDNPEATAKAKEIISQYAQGKIASREEFQVAIQEVRNMLYGDNVKDGKSVIQDNYLEIADTIKQRTQNAESIERMLEGFRVLNAEVRADVRTEVHRTALDNIINKLQERKQNSPFRAVPDAAIAGVAGVAAVLSQSTLAKLTAGAAGVAFAAAKEGNRVAKDRAQRQRELAMGIQTGETKYDQKVAETTYYLRPANELTASINAAVESGNNTDLAIALADAETLISRTDQGKEHISYSAPEKIEEERWALDLAIAQAKSNFTDEQRKTYNTLKDYLQNPPLNENGEKEETFDSMLEENEEASDLAYRKLRRRRMATTAGTTALATAAFYIGSQEVMAAFDPKTYGLADRAFNLQNESDAKSTLLAKALGFEPQNVVTTTIEPQIAQRQTLTEEQVQELRDQGMTVNEYTEVTTHTENITRSTAEIANEQGIDVQRIGWANSNTQYQVYYTDGKEGLVTGFSSDPTWAGGAINFDQEATAGNIKMLVTLEQGQKPLEVGAQVLGNGRVEFLPDAGSAADVAFSNGFQGAFAEIVYEGEVVNGVQQVIPLATIGGQGLSGSIEIAQEVVSIETFYDVIRAGSTSSINIPSEVSTAGVILPFSILPYSRRRSNLTYAEPGNSEPTEPETTPPEGTPTQASPESTAEDTSNSPEPTSEDTAELTEASPPDQPTENNVTPFNSEDLLSATNINPNNLRSGNRDLQIEEYRKIASIGPRDSGYDSVHAFLRRNNLETDYNSWLDDEYRSAQQAA